MSYHPFAESLQQSEIFPSISSSLQLYAVAVKDLVRKTDKIYKVKSRNSTVEYTIKKLEPGGKYHVIVQLGNMSKESSMKINTGEGHAARPVLPAGWRNGSAALGPLPQPKPSSGRPPRGGDYTPKQQQWRGSLSSDTQVFFSW